MKTSIAPATDMHRPSMSELTLLLDTILRAHGCSPRNAAVIAANMAAAERDGSRSHGVFRLRDYLSTLESGYVDGLATPIVHDAAAGFIRVDARNGYAQVALADAGDRLADKARSQGIAVLAIRESHHLGALYLDVEGFAEVGLLALSLVNSMAVVAPPGANRAVYGTNPVAFAAPVAGSAPLIFDQASSTMAHGDVRVAAREGRALEPGAGIDRNGEPTADPHEILNGGALLTFGGHKGASIALMVEILCAGLVGSQFSFEVDWSAHPGARSPRTGQTVIVIDPSVGAGHLAPLSRRTGDLVDALGRAGQSRLPGRRRVEARAKALVEGIPIDRMEWSALEALARKR